MKNKRMPKTLLAFFSVAIIFANNGLVLAKKNKGKQETVSKHKNKKVRKIRNKEYEKWNKNREIELKEEDKLLSENFEMSKKIKIEDYEVKGFKLTVYFKNGVPILYYEHIKTKAKIIMILVDTLDESLAERLGDMYFFKASVPNDSGIVHLAEHCIASPGITSKLNEKFKNLGFSAETDRLGFRLSLRSEFLTEEAYKEFFSLLREPKIFEDEELFEKEKRRAIIEIIDKYKNSSADPEFYSSGGVAKEMEKVTLEEVRWFCANYVNPSNLLVVKNVKMDAEKIKNYLKNMEEDYLRFFDYIEVKQPNYGYKQFFPFTRYKLSFKDYKDLFIYEDETEKKKYKYSANLLYMDKESLKSSFEKYDDTFLRYDGKFKLNPIFTLGLKYFNGKKSNELNEFVKSLGYKAIKFNNNSFLNYMLYGEDPSLFEEEKLREANFKIFNFILNRFKNYSDEDILLNSEILQPTDYDVKLKFKNLKYFANPVYYNKNMIEIDGKIVGLGEIFALNCWLYDDPFHKKTLNIDKNNKIINSEKKVIKKIKDSINNLEKLINLNDLRILTFERNDDYNGEINSFEKEDVKNRNFLIPLEIKNYGKNNALEKMVSNFLVKKLFNEIVFNKAINYYGLSEKNFIGKYIGICEVPTLKSLKLREIIKDYFYNYSIEFIKNLEISEEEFEKLKLYFKAATRVELKEIEENKLELEKIIKVFEDYVENEKPRSLDDGKIKINKKTRRKNLYEKISKKLEDMKYMMYASYKEYVNKKKLENNFIKKYELNKDLDCEDKPINKQFIKDLKKYLKLKYEPFKYAEKFNKEAMEKIDGISYEDFVGAVKSVSLVKKSVFEKDQKVEDELNS